MATTPLSAILQHMHNVLSNHRGRQLSDGELLRRFTREGDQKAFTALVHRHGKLVMGVCRRLLRHQQDAEDAFQATFMVLARKASAVQWQDSIQSWLYSTAVRVAKEARVRSARRSQHERQASQSPPNPSGASEAYSGLCELLDEELLRLPESCRQALIHCYFQGQTRDRAAATLGWSVRTLDRRLERGRNLLRFRLQKRGIGLSIALLVGGLEQSAAGAVSGVLVHQTVVSAISFAVADSIILDSTAAALSEVALQSLSGSALKFAPVLFCVVAFAALCTGWAAHRGFAVMGPVVQTEKPRTPVPQPEQPATRMARPAVDLSGEPLPDGAIARLGTIRFRHDRNVAFVSYALDGKALVSGGMNNGDFYVWDTVTSKVLRRIKVPLTWAPRAVSADGRILLTDSLALFDIATGKEIGQFQPARQAFFWVALSSDARTAAAVEMNGGSPIVLWDVASCVALRTLEGHVGRVEDLCFSPDGKILATSGEDKTLRLWDVGTGKEIRKIDTKASCMVSFAPDGKTLASSAGLGGFGHLVRLRDVATAEMVRELPGTEGDALVSYSPDGKLLATSNRIDTVRLWDPTSGKEIRRWRAPNLGWQMAFSPDSKVLAAASGSTIVQWDVATGNELDPAAGHRARIHSLRFDEEGKTLFSSSIMGDGTFLRWDVATSKVLSRHAVPPLYDVQEKWQGRVQDHTPDQQIIGGPKFGIKLEPGIHLWDARTGNLLRTLPGTDTPLAKFSVDGKLLLSRNIDGIGLWRVDTGKLLQHWDLPEKEKAKDTVVLSPDNRWLAVARADRTIRIFSTGDGKEVRRWAEQKDVRALAFSPDGKLLASGTFGGAVRLWDVDSGKETARFTAPAVVESSLTFSHDGRVIAASHSKRGALPNQDPQFTSTLGLWEALTGQEIVSFESGGSEAHALAFTSDGRTLASGGDDSSILLWDLTGQQKVGKRPPPTRADLDALWADLGKDAAKAYRALWALVLAPEKSMPCLKDRLKPVVPVPADQAAKLISDLDSDSFAVRDKAVKTLEELGEAVESAVHKALQGKPALETRRRLELIVEKFDKGLFQKLRAIAALEHIGTAQAQEVLQGLTTAPNPRVADAAAMSLQRMACRPNRDADR
jgi:RNA polymerase sigma factor (sigma-70 family)